MVHAVVAQSTSRSKALGQKLNEIMEELAANTKKLDEIEARIDKIVSICKEANVAVPDEISEAISKSIKEARDLASTSKSNQ